MPVEGAAHHDEIVASGQAVRRASAAVSTSRPAHPRRRYICRRRRTTLRVIPLATGWIDYGSESDSPVFERLELLKVGPPFERTSDGVGFTAVAVSLRSHVLESRYSSKQFARDIRSTIWFRHTSEGWRIAKDPYFAASQDPHAPPGSETATTLRPSQPAKPSRQELERAAGPRRRQRHALSARAGLVLLEACRQPDARSVGSRLGRRARAQPATRAASR